MLGLLLLGALSFLTGGGFFLHAVTANVNEFRWEQVSYNLSTIQGLLPLLLIGALAFIVLGLHSRPPAWWMVGTYLLGSAAAALLIGKVGSDANYLLALSAALTLASGALISRYASRPGARCAMLLALAAQVAIMVQASQYVYAGLQADVIAPKAGLVRLEEIVDNSKGPVLADEYAGLLPLDGRRIYLQPFEMTRLQSGQHVGSEPTPHVHRAPRVTCDFLRLSRITTTALVSARLCGGRPHPEEIAEAPSRPAPTL